MNKYEHARILAERAKQLENGAEPTVDIAGLDDALRIAQKELLEGVIPLKIRRRELDGPFELEELSGEDESERLSRADDGDSGESGDESENEDLAGEISSEDGDLGNDGNSDASEDE